MRKREETFNEKLTELEKKLKIVIENNASVKNDSKRENEQLKCNDCEFTTTSKKGLKTHIRRKHITVFPVHCEICTKELKSSQQMKSHMVTHTYSDLKCEECKFLGNNDWSMQIHNGKYHSQNIECGLCEFKANDKEGLDLHLKTCETYECQNCEYVAKTISEMKKHRYEKSKECLSTTIFHVKTDRNDENQANFKEYKENELF